MQEVFHRGLRIGEHEVQAPNSFEALINARPGDTLEVDVIELADGELAIVHNKDVTLLMEAADSMNIADFQVLDQPTKDTQTVPGIKMPLFKELLFQAGDRGVNMLVELKASTNKKMLQVVDTIVAELKKIKEESAFQNNKDVFLNHLAFHTFSVDGAARMIEQLKAAGMEKIPVSIAWPTSESFAQDMEITKPDVALASKIRNTDDWIEKGMYVARSVGCVGIGMHSRVLVEHPEYIDKAHSLGLWIAGGGIEDPTVREGLAKHGLDKYFSETFI